MTPRVEIRTDLRPGDIGAIVRLHGDLYAAEYSLDTRFEAEVAHEFGKVVQRGFPAAGEGAWIAERDGEVVGGIFLVRESDALGRVHWFILHPSVRGQGVGRQLVGALMSSARAHGYERLWLRTFSALEAATHLYRDAGFTRVGAEPSDRWGPPISMEAYEAVLGNSSTTTSASTA